MRRLLESFKIAGALLLAAMSSQAASASTFGTPLTPEIAVASLSGGYTAGTAVARDSSGNFVVLWSPTDGSPTSFRRFAADGTPLTDVIPLSSINSTIVQLAMDDAGDFVVTWAERGTAPSFVTTVFAQVFSPNGAATTAPIAVAQSPAEGTYVTLAQLFSGAVAMTASGDFVVGWSGYTFYSQGKSAIHDAITTSFVRTRRFHLDGTAHGNAQDVATATYPWLQTAFLGINQIAMSPNGNYAVLWGDFSGSKMQFFSADGTATGKPISYTLPGYVQQQPHTKYPTSAVSSIQASLAGNGDLLIADEVYDPSGAYPAPFTVYYQRFSSAGVATSAVVTVATGLGTEDIAIDSTSSAGSVVTWGDYSTQSIYSRAFSSSDVAASDVFTIADNLNPDRQFRFSMALDPNDNLLVIWGGVTAQLFQGP